MFMLLAVDTFLLIVEGDGYCKGQVFVKSQKIIFEFRQAFRKKKFEQRSAWAIKGLKIYVGSTNYYDRLFALNTLNFNTNQIVTLLLSSR